MKFSWACRLWMCFVPLERGWPIQGYTLTENCSAHSEKFLIANSFPARVSTLCPPPSSLLRLDWVVTTQVLWKFSELLWVQKLLEYKLLKTNGIHMRLKLPNFHLINTCFSFGSQTFKLKPFWLYSFSLSSKDTILINNGSKN